MQNSNDRIAKGGNKTTKNDESRTQVHDQTIIK